MRLSARSIFKKHPSLIKYGTAFWLTVVCCTPLPSEASQSYSQTFSVTLEQPVQIKANKALCSLQGQGKQHIKRVLADVIETFNYDGIEYTTVEITTQSHYLNEYITVECR